MNKAAKRRKWDWQLYVLKLCFSKFLIRFQREDFFFFVVTQGMCEGILEIIMPWTIVKTIGRPAAKENDIYSFYIVCQK